MVEELLQEFQFSAPVRKVHDMMVKTILSKSFAQRKRSKETIDKEIDQVNMKLANIDDKWALNEMSADEHRRLHSKFSFQLGQLMNEKDAYCNENTELSRYLKSGVNIMADLKGFYRKANINTREKLLGSIFPETMQFQIRIVEPLESMRRYCKCWLPARVSAETKTDNSSQI